MKDQSSLFSPKPTSPVEMFVQENYLGGSEDTEFKITIINFIEEFKEFKGDAKKHLREIKEK